MCEKSARQNPDKRGLFPEILVANTSVKVDEASDVDIPPAAVSVKLIYPAANPSFL